MLKNLIVNPLFVFSCLWLCLPLVSTSLVFFGFFDFYPLSYLFYIYVYLFVISWVLGGAGAYLVFSNALYSHISIRFPALCFRSSIFIVFVVCVFYLFFRVLEIISTTGVLSVSPSNIGYFRLLVTELGIPLRYNFINVLNPVFFALPAFCFYVYSSRVQYRWFALFLFVLLFLLFVYLSSARSAAFVAILVLFFVMLYNKVKLIYMLFFPAALFLLFGVVGYIAGKPGFHQFFIYLLAPMHAFDVLINDNPLSYELLSFRPIHGFLYDVGLISQRFHLIDYVNTPYPVNVYTVFGVYYNDYGLAGTVLALVYFSFLTCFFHIYARSTRSLRFEVLSSFFLSYIILGAFYDYYTSSMFSLIAPFLLFVLLPKNKFRAEDS